MLREVKFLRPFSTRTSSVDLARLRVSLRMQSVRTLTLRSAGASHGTNIDRGAACARAGAPLDIHTSTESVLQQGKAHHKKVHEYGHSPLADLIAWLYISYTDDAQLGRGGNPTQLSPPIHVWLVPALRLRSAPPGVQTSHRLSLGPPTSQGFRFQERAATCSRS